MRVADDRSPKTCQDISSAVGRAVTNFRVVDRRAVRVRSLLALALSHRNCYRSPAASPHLGFGVIILLTHRRSAQPQEERMPRLGRACGSASGPSAVTSDGQSLLTPFQFPFAQPLNVVMSGQVLVTDGHLPWRPTHAIGSRTSTMRC